MKRLLVVLLLIIFLLLTIRAVHAAGSTTYTLDWWTIGGGGGTSQAGTYSLNGTIGQAETGSLHGGEYALVGGFWADLQAAWKKMFLPIMHKS